MGVADAGDGVGLTDDKREPLRLVDADTVDDRDCDSDRDGEVDALADEVGEGVAATARGVCVWVRDGEDVLTTGWSDDALEGEGDGDAVDDGEAEGEDVVVCVGERVAEPCCSVSLRLITPPVLLYSPGLVLAYEQGNGRRANMKGTAVHPHDAGAVLTASSCTRSPLHARGAFRYATTRTRPRGRRRSSNERVPQGRRH